MTLIEIGKDYDEGTFCPGHDDDGEPQEASDRDVVLAGENAGLHAQQGTADAGEGADEGGGQGAGGALNVDVAGTMADGSDSMFTFNQAIGQGAPVAACDVPIADANAMRQADGGRLTLPSIRAEQWEPFHRFWSAKRC